jgi:predicted dehydrogenase
MAESGMSRRDFVETSAAALAAFTIVPRHVLGGRGFRAPSDTLNVACIGVGGMGRNDVQGMSGENIYALCDVDDKQAEDAFHAFPRAKRYRDYREMLDKEAKNIDAVTVSTPDHSHAAASILALRLGKPTYCQKPLARTMGEVQAMMDAATKAKVATQMGNQGHSHEGTRRLRELVEAGAIGTVKEVHYWTNRPIWPQGVDRPVQAYNVPPTLDWDLWLGPAHERPYAPDYAPFKWRGWWDFGCGALGDIAPHAMDAAFWTLGLGYPTRIEAETTPLFPESAPAASRIVYDFPARAGRPALRVVWRDGGLTAGKPAGLPEGVEWPLGGDPGHQLWIGTDGMLVADVYGDDPRLLDPKRDAEVKAHPPAAKYPRTEGVYKEWIAAIKHGGRAGSDFAGHAGPLTKMLLLGNLAVRLQQPIELNPTTGEVTNAKVPEEWVRPTYRMGWSL